LTGIGRRRRGGLGRITIEEVVVRPCEVFARIHRSGSSDVVIGGWRR